MKTFNRPDYKLALAFISSFFIFSVPCIARPSDNQQSTLRSTNPLQDATLTGIKMVHILIEGDLNDALKEELQRKIKTSMHNANIEYFDEALATKNIPKDHGIVLRLLVGKAEDKSSGLVAFSTRLEINQRMFTYGDISSPRILILSPTWFVSDLGIVKASEWEKKCPTSVDGLLVLFVEAYFRVNSRRSESHGVLTPKSLVVDQQMATLTAQQ